MHRTSALCFVSLLSLLPGGSRTVHADHGEPPSRVRDVVWHDDSRTELAELLQQDEDELVDLADATAIYVFESKEELCESGRCEIEQATRMPGGLPICSDETRARQRFWTEATKCTAFLVAPTKLISAGHCFSNTDSTINIIPSNDSIAFGWAIESLTQSQGPSSIPDDYVFNIRDITRQKGADGLDWAVLTLEEPVTDRTPIPLDLGDSIQVGDEVTSMCYSGGVPLKIDWTHALVINGVPAYYFDGPVLRSTSTNWIKADVDSTGICSGSPLFGEVNGQIKALGALSTGSVRRWETDTAKNCQRHRRCPESGCAYNRYTRVSKIAPYLNYSDDVRTLVTVAL